MTAAAVGSRADEKAFDQNAPTAAGRTWDFHLVLTADQGNAVGLVPVMTISKAGGAFAAVNVGTVITELANGWYKVVHAIGDLDTLGDLAVRIVIGLADPINMNHIVRAPLATAAAVASLAAAGDIARRTSHAIGPCTTAARTSLAKSLAHIIDATVSFAGVFGAAASMQVQTTEDGVNWTNYGAAVVAAGSTPITEAHFAVRAVLAAGDGATAVVVTLAIRTYK